MVRIYTDGSCLGNPGPGGWAWAIPEGASASGGDAHTTNQRMEIQAVLEALRSIDDREIEIISDSTYVVKCFQDRWWAGWQGGKSGHDQPCSCRRNVNGKGTGSHPTNQH